MSAPHSIEAEQSVLGALLYDPNCFDKVAQVITAESFFNAEHRAVFESIASLVNGHRPCDVLTVNEHLKGRGHEVGMVFLNELAQSAMGSGAAVRHAGIVRERASQRSVLEAVSQAAIVASESGSVMDKLDKIAALFTGIDKQQHRKMPKSMSDLIVHAIDRYESLADGKAPRAWPTGIHPLDRILNGGLRPGKLYGVAARPSVGKSSASRAMAVHLAMHGVESLILSQEMPTDEVADCIVAQLGRVDGGRLQSGAFEQEDWARIVEATDKAKSMTLHVDDDGGLTIQQIAAKCRAVKGLKVLVLDYLQLSQATNTKASTNDQVAEISKGLKRLALNMNIAIVVLSQLNRDVEKRADKEPVLADLRDSGAIEQDLDVAVLLWTSKQDEKSRLVGWKVAKHRGGRVGRFAMRFEPSVYSWIQSDESLDTIQAVQFSQKKGFS